MKKQVIIDFIGTHSTGKTSIIDFTLTRLRQSEWRNLSAVHIPSVSRPGVCNVESKIYKDTTTSSQAFMSFANWGEIFHAAMYNDVTLCTDLLVRSFAYTLTAPNIDKSLIELHKKWLDVLMNYLNFSSHIQPYWIYLPIEFDMVEDGVRLVDKTFREEVDNNIKHVLKTCKIPYITLTGKHDKRCKQMNYLLERILFQKTSMYEGL